MAANDLKPWFDPDITEAPAPIRALLENYSHIPADDVVPHINRIRAKGFAASPYLCLGQFRFLNLTLALHPMYTQIVERLRSDPSATYLDVGCCFGQDLRQLAAAGVPSRQLTGLDIAGPLMDLGYELFADRATLASEFLAADVFRGATQGDPWTRLQARGADVVHASAFFHLFPLASQLEAAKNVAGLVRPDGIIVGCQVGSVAPGEGPALRAGTTAYRHDVASLQKMWDSAGQANGTRWRVEGFLDTVGLTFGQAAVKKNPLEDENSRRLVFTIRRLA